MRGGGVRAWGQVRVAAHGGGESPRVCDRRCQAGVADQAEWVDAGHRFAQEGQTLWSNSGTYTFA